jgi:hypothetical protein
MFRLKLYSGLLFVAFLQLSCKKDSPIKEPDKSDDPVLVIYFEPTVYSSPLIPNKKIYTNFSNDSFTVSKFNYYISNIRLRRADSSIYQVPESYHLIEHVEGIQKITLFNFPEGDFTEMEFLIGVDSLRNVSGSQSGDLDPSRNMFWDWDTGYIFYKLEGKFNTLAWPEFGDYAIHIGGYSGKDNAIQKCSFPLKDGLRTRKYKVTTITFTVKLEEVFETPTKMDFTHYYITLENNNAKMISENYRDMFILQSIQH